MPKKLETPEEREAYYKKRDNLESRIDISLSHLESDVNALIDLNFECQERAGDRDLRMLQDTVYLCQLFMASWRGFF